MWTVYEELQGIKKFKIRLVKGKEEVNSVEADRVILKCGDKIV